MNKQYFDELRLSPEGTHLEVVNTQEGYVTPLRADVVMGKTDFSNLDAGMWVGHPDGAPFWRREPFRSKKELDDYHEMVGRLFQRLGRQP